ncbi:FAD binding domain-containing protein [Amniculicola lignicola CBS 123094]|uniref:FAD binding domain-containing protein n=1 Tax=Amniculicola lignicola CBS 123094 TaxID=1392246 RepID=A0A6A5W762_9PLEO|nr:FAD binding domain-containing protein [Amniculicola lignicola CBS 123094]
MGDAPTPQRLDIIIVGAGLSGLATAIQCALSGHNITVLEGARELAEIGAGLQLTPNSTRLLQKWGVYERLSGPCEPSTCTVYNYTGKILAHEDSFDKNIHRKYNAPFTDCHRVDLQQALVERARELGVKVVLDAKVMGLNFGKEKAGEDSEPPKATAATENGQSFSADLIVGADGLWSTCRSVFLGRRDAPLPTGDLAFRIVLELSQIRDEKLRKMVQEPGVRFWVGPESHAVGYSMRGGDMYNVVLLVPDDLPDEVARMEGSLEEMRSRFTGWDPVLTQLLSCVSRINKWKLMHRAELPSWINPQSNLVLVGDACHPMLPYLAQGANSSIEDGAVLGLLLSSTSSSPFVGKSQLPARLKLFEKLRKKRGEAIVRETFKQRRDFHLPDGPEQEARDQIFEKWFGKDIGEAFPSRWTCPVVQKWLYGYDADKEVEAALAGGEK